MFENRKLKREIAILSDENDDLRASLKAYKKEAEDVNQLRLKALREVDSSIEKDKKINDELTELKTKVRAQNEADLMFVSVKIISELFKGKKLEEVKPLQQDISEYIKAYQQAQQSSGYQANGLNILMRNLGF